METLQRNKVNPGQHARQFVIACAMGWSATGGTAMAHGPAQGPWDDRMPALVVEQAEPAGPERGTQVSGRHSDNKAQSIHHDDPCGSRCVAEKRLWPLFAWIREHSDYNWQPGQHDVPAVQVLNGEDLAYRLFLNPDEATPERVASVSERIEGVYRHTDRIIFLNEDLDLDTVYGRSALLHELIHFLQYETAMNQNVKCRAELERDAYELQNLYLAQYGEPEVTDTFTIIMRSACWKNVWGS